MTGGTTKPRYLFIIRYIQLTNKTDRYSAHQEVLPLLMKPEISMSYSKQLPLHSTKNQLNVVWYGPEGKSCTVTKLYSCLPCRVYPCWPVTRCTMHITLHTKQTVTFLNQHLKRTHIIYVCCFKSAWLFFAVATESQRRSA